MLCTAVLRELSKRGHKKLWMMSNHSELFNGNADIEKVVPVDQRFENHTTLWRGKYQHLEYAATDCEQGMSVPPARHIIAELCLRAGIKGEIALRPYFYLTAAEKEKASWAGGTIAIQSSGLGGIMQMRNKQWFPDRFQEVVSRLKNNYKFVQVGAASDPRLNDTIDLRGKTSIRETAAILSNCHIYVGNVGFLMHLARAVECPSVIIYGGREAPWQSGYVCNLNLYSPVPCAPCWLWNKCDHDRVCMENITVNKVVAAIQEIMARPCNPLAIESFTI